MILEIACFNMESAFIAQRAGADRIELCDDYAAGGLTPSFNAITKAIKELSIPVFVMIRPRSGNFIYTGDEFRRMKQQVLFCKAAGAEGIVFGILDSDGNIDKARCRELVALANPMQTTFHRAFDEVKSPLDAMDELIACGFSRVLTSGRKSTARQGAEMISLLVKKANGNIHIMPGGGVRSDNLIQLKKKTGASEFHSAAINPETKLVEEEEVRKLKFILK
jgi:copper homeostasis protein